MFIRRKPLAEIAKHGPLRVMFVITSMPVGGAETLLVELVRRLDREPLSAGTVLPERASVRWAKCWPARFPFITA